MSAGAGCGSPAARGPATAGSDRIGDDQGADLVLLGGALMTMNADTPSATALAIRSGRIAAVGSDEEMRALIGAATRVIQLDGRSVTPGLVDGHAHLAGLGAAMDAIDLRGVGGEAEAAARVASAARQNASDGAGQDEWLVGRGWDQNTWSPQQFPNRASLDRAVGDRPVALRRIDGHALWASSRALALAGVNRDTADPPGGKIIRAADGEPTGVFVDNAMGLIEARIPPPSPAAIRKRIARAAEVAIASGLTGVHEMGIDDTTVEVYRAMAAEGALPLRIYAFASFGGDPDEFANKPRYLDEASGMFTLRAIKAYADGALGSRGAALLEPYSDEPDGTGLMLTDPRVLGRLADVAASSGWQVGVHAIGDRANRAVLDAYRSAAASHPDADLRFRVEHAQIVAIEDLPRFGSQHVIASMQPTHCTSDMPWAESRVGPERIRGAYAWRSILDSGGRIVAGSDFPVEEVPPIHGLYAAISRRDRDGQPEDGWYADQTMSLAEAVAAFTAEAAYASFSERTRGRLAVGFDADLTVFDRQLVAGPELLQTGIDATIVGGRVVYSSPRWSSAQTSARPAPSPSRPDNLDAPARSVVR